MMSLKKLSAVLALTLPLMASAQTSGTGPLGLKFKFSGDLNHQFTTWTNQNVFFGGSETIGTAATIQKNDVKDTYMLFKYRLQFEGALQDDSVRGVYNIEVGGIRFGQAGNKLSGTDAIGTNGGSYSGDGDNYETRFAYLDFGLPGVKGHRLVVGLQPIDVNHYLWQETATALQYKGTVGPAKLTLGWIRGRDVFSSNSAQEVTADGDNYLVRGDFVPSKDVKFGAFVLYQHQKPDTGGTATGASYEIKRFGADAQYDIYNLGVDGALKFGDIFVNFDGIYQGGTVKPGFDVNAFFGHADIGVNVGALKLTYTGWYASGDDKPADKKIKNFMATDVDMFDSVVIFETYNDEAYFTEAPYFLNFGGIFNKIAADFKARPNVTLGVAGMYIQTAKDITLVGGKKTKNIGTEFDAYVSYKPYPQLELAINAGYLISGDAMDRFEAAPITGNGKADKDIFRSTGRIRYIF